MEDSLLGVDWQSNLSAIVEETNSNLRHQSKLRRRAFADTNDENARHPSSSGRRPGGGAAPSHKAWSVPEVGFASSSTKTGSSSPTKSRSVLGGQLHGHTHVGGGSAVPATSYSTAVPAASASASAEGWRSAVGAVESRSAQLERELRGFRDEIYQHLGRIDEDRMARDEARQQRRVAVDRIERLESNLGATRDTTDRMQSALESQIPHLEHLLASAEARTQDMQHSSTQLREQVHMGVQQYAAPAV
jgi:hypothetical protein